MFTSIYIFMKTHNRYLIYLLYFALTIPAVIITFKFIEPKKLASLLAATLFISCSLLVFWGELKNSSKKSFSLWAAVVFFLVFSAPMLIGRLIYYNLDFSEINFGPLSGPEFHKYSNYGFMFLLTATIVDYLTSRKILFNSKN